jgi:hypothetical protein
VTDPTRREIEERIADLEDASDGTEPAAVYASLVAVASGTANDADRDRLRAAPRDMVEAFVGES